MTPQGRSVDGGGDTIVFSPEADTAAQSQLASFLRYCEAKLARTFTDFNSFYEFSTLDFRTFWRLFLAWTQLDTEGSVEPVCLGTACEDAQFFPNLRLNYAELLLSDQHGWDRIAVTTSHADGTAERLTRRELRAHVVCLAKLLQDHDVKAGDRVGLIARNNSEALIAALATASIGAVLSSCSPEMGTLAILSRLSQVQPVALMSVFRTQPWDAGDVTDRIVELVRQLPSLTLVISLDDETPSIGGSVTVVRVADIFAEETAVDEFVWPRFAFNHPLFILFSSGTTGAPKCIMHGAGGTLIEHVKEHRLHCDLQADDKLFFQTSCGWMMWNWQLTALASGVGLVLFDGPVAAPETLWRVVDEEAVTVFGTSPAYLRWCERADFAPRGEFALTMLRSILSTGSVLSPPQFDWVMDAVKRLPLQSISGGTDIIGCFVLGNPLLPVYRGAAQCRSLALDVRSLPTPASSNANVGELICAQPFPSRPIGFFGDTDGKRFHAAYFEQNPGVWTHGDLIELTQHGGCILHGRSDGILNISGIRIGPAEIYRILEEVGEVVESMAVEQTASDSRTDSRMILLVVLRKGISLDDALITKIRTTLTERGSAALVPARIVAVEELPTTHSGKRSETAARDALNGHTVRNKAALQNPASLDAIVAAVARLRHVDEDHRLSGLSPKADPQELEAALQRLCAQSLGLESIEPSADFFKLGADSLSIVSMVLALQKQLGFRLQFSLVHRASSVRQLCQLIRQALHGDPGDLAKDRSSEDGPKLTVRPASAEDADAICHLLADGFADDRISPDRWRKLLNHPWLAKGPTSGFVAVSGDRIVGFIGIVHADRVIDGRSSRVCNLTSWYVRPDYRGFGGYLLAAAVGNEMTSYTAFTPIAVTQHALTRLGFKQVGGSRLFMPPFLHMRSLLHKAPRITFDRDEVQVALKGDHRKMFDDHEAEECVQMVAIDGDDYCYLVAKRRARRVPLSGSIPYSEVLYCSDAALLMRHLERIKLALLRKQRTIALVVCESFFAGERPRAMKLPNLTMYRSERLNGAQIDMLYSEFLLLPV